MAVRARSRMAAGALRHVLAGAFMAIAARLGRLRAAARIAVAPRIRSLLAAGLLALAAGCSGLSEPGGPPVQQDAEPLPVGELPAAAWVRDSTLVLEYRGRDGSQRLAARWEADPAAAGAHQYLVAHLDAIDLPADDPARPARESRPVRLLDQSAWDALLTDLMAQFVPPGATEATMITVQGIDMVVHRSADGALRWYPHERKPPALRVVRVVPEPELTARADALLAERHGRDAAVLFANGDVDAGQAFVLFDLAHRVSVLIAPAAAPAASAQQTLGFALSMTDALLLRSHVLTVVTRPATATTRLIWLATQSARVMVPGVPPGPEQPVPPVADAAPMDLAAWERRLDGLAGTPAYRGSMAPLIDGEAYFTALVQAIQDARESIDVRVYIFDRDDYALRIADLLKARSREVRVRVLLDQIGTGAAGQIPSNAPYPYGRRRDAPLSIEQYLREDSEVEVRASPNPWLTSDHTKTIVIDRRRAFAGGMNIGYEYRYEWHDLMVALEGPIVGRLVRDFQRAWAGAGAGGDIAYAAASATGDKDGGPPADAAHDMLIRPLYTRAADPGILRSQLAAIRAARRYIWIEQPYVSDDTIIAALAQARQRGVDVRLILPSRGDSGLMNSANLIAANALLRHGVRIYAYPGMTHVKAALYDGWAVVGSANFDKLSLRVNLETDLATSDPRFADTLKRELFERDFQRSREITTLRPVGWSGYLSGFIARQL